MHIYKANVRYDDIRVLNDWSVKFLLEVFFVNLGKLFNAIWYNTGIGCCSKCTSLLGAFVDNSL